MHRLTEAERMAPAMAFSLAECLGEEMAARGWTIEDVADRMAVNGPARDALTLALVMSVQEERLLLDSDFIAGLARAFDMSAEFFHTIHAAWLSSPAARLPYSVPDSLFGPRLRAALNTKQIFNGVRIYMQGSRMLSGQANVVDDDQRELARRALRRGSNG